MVPSVEIRVNDSRNVYSMYIRHYLIICMLSIWWLNVANNSLVLVWCNIKACLHHLINLVTMFPSLSSYLPPSHSPSCFPPLHPSPPPSLSPFNSFTLCLLLCVVFHTAPWHTNLMYIFSPTALVWQLMKAYTLSILTKLAGQEGEHPMVDKEVVAWANEKVRQAFKRTTQNIKSAWFCHHFWPRW